MRIINNSISRNSISLFSIVAALAAILLLSACSSSPPPKGVKIGKPYSIGGKMYYPEHDATYDETGIASWYGPGFHGGRTANGEKFDSDDLTAAHPTLPMPSLVRVTNRENGKILVVRVNDRGPFAEGRIIDLSKESAKRLGIKGLAKVRVQYLEKESKQYVEAISEGRNIDMFAYNQRLEDEKETSLLAATAPSENESFIVEALNNFTKSDNKIAQAAPILSVNNSDLPAQQVTTETVETNNDNNEVVLNNLPLLAEKQIDYKKIDGKTENEKNKNNVAGIVDASGGYMIQVGSFSKQENAKKMLSAVSTIAKANMPLVQIGGNKWWRVVAGPFSSHEEAVVALADIRENLAADARIVRR